MPHPTHIYQEQPRCPHISPCTIKPNRLIASIINSAISTHRLGTIVDRFICMSLISSVEVQSLQMVDSVISTCHTCCCVSPGRMVDGSGESAGSGALVGTVHHSCARERLMVGCSKALLEGQSGSRYGQGGNRVQLAWEPSHRHSGGRTGSYASSNMPGIQLSSSKQYNITCSDPSSVQFGLSTGILKHWESSSSLGPCSQLAGLEGGPAGGAAPCPLTVAPVSLLDRLSTPPPSQAS